MRAWELNDSDTGGLHLIEAPDPQLRPGAAVVDVLAVHVPAYTAVLTTGLRGHVPTPLILGTGGVGRVRAVAPDVFGLHLDDVVLNAGLLRSSDITDQEEFILSWTGIGGRGERTADIARMQEVWRDGTFAERAVLPAQVLVRLPGAQDDPRPERLAVLPWLSIAAEALVRGEQQPGDVVAVLGATGQLGGAAVLMALARGASRVVAVGRDRVALERLAGLDPRVTVVALGGDRVQDAAAVRAAGEPDLVLDTLGATDSAEPTLTGFDSLRPGGTLVLVGGVRHDLALPYGHLMRRRLSVRGSWMARPETVSGVWRLVRSGTVDLDQVTVRTVGLHDPAAALKLAADTGGLDFVVLLPSAL
ncbi:hypothetical protein GCM10022223_14050 [Kineosporia mesophila]|uniref:Alcohol dehydrogenase n=1 Tax=Kineosporia mesophila TaxID=566012 RepID=A0ABP6Z6X8_9ACTN|nr:zinc-binding dehydrogenase [Kineosporia mesophila]MCD5354813.1 zinc-binding dehydrogenase [Kineosporia mesophila]